MPSVLLAIYEFSGEGLEFYLDKLDDMAHERWLAPGTHFTCRHDMA